MTEQKDGNWEAMEFGIGKTESGKLKSIA